MFHLVEFTGPFGYLKPWTAVRDGKTNSLTFLTPATVEGMRQKLCVSAIARYRLSYAGIDWQQEVTQARDFTLSGRPAQRTASRPRSIILRGVLVQPRLILAFESLEDAEHACHQHLCLSRNEDVLFPNGRVTMCEPADFEQLPGTELLTVAEDEPGAVLVGHNRYQANAPMYGRLLSTQALTVFGADSPLPNVH